MSFAVLTNHCSTRNHPRFGKASRITLLAGVAATMLSAHAAVDALAQEVINGGEAGGAKPRNEQVLSTEGRIFRGNSLFGTMLKTKDGQPAGRITNLVLDLDQGRLTMIVLAADKSLN